MREASAAAAAVLACQLNYLELTKTQPAGYTGEGLLCQLRHLKWEDPHLIWETPYHVSLHKGQVKGDFALRLLALTIAGKLISSLTLEHTSSGFWYIQNTSGDI